MPRGERSESLIKEEEAAEEVERASGLCPTGGFYYSGTVARYILPLDRSGLPVAGL